MGNLLIADSGNGTIRKVTLTDGSNSVSTLVSNLGIPTGLAFQGGKLYIADMGQHLIRMLDPLTGTLSTFVGSGTQGYSQDGASRLATDLNAPSAIAFDLYGDLYIADQGNHVIRKVSIATSTISTVAGSGTAGAFGDDGKATDARLYSPSAIVFDMFGSLMIADTGNHVIRKITDPKIDPPQISTLAP